MLSDTVSEPSDPIRVVYALSCNHMLHCTYAISAIITHCIVIELQCRKNTSMELLSLVKH